MKKRPIVIIGASGHGRVVSDIAFCNGYKDILFLDDSEHPELNVVGKVCDFEKYINTADFFVAIGNNKIREMIFDKLRAKNAVIASLIHPNATLSDDVLVGQGTVVMAGAVVNTGAVLGNGVIINTCSSVDHDCCIGDFVHISVGAHLAGTVNVGKNTFVCAGATVINNLTICEDCTVGAGAVVINDIKEKGTYVGVPSRKI